MKSRLIASVALSAAVLLGATGCALVSTQATTMPYSAGDGVNIPDSGPILVRNALIVTDEAGESPALVAALVNQSADPETLTIEIGEGSSAQSFTVEVPAGDQMSLGDASEDTPPLELGEVDALPGSMAAVYFQSGDAEGVLYQVPVLDNALDYYGDLLP